MIDSSLCQQKLCDGPIRRRDPSAITILLCRCSLGITLLCSIIVGWGGGSLLICIFAIPCALPYLLTEAVARLIRNYYAASFIFMLVTLVLSGLRLFLIGSFCLAVTQPVDENAGDNMIGILPILDLRMFVSAQLSVAVLFAAVFAAYRFFRRNRFGV